VLTFLALVTLGLKTAVEWRQRRGTQDLAEDDSALERTAA
jgi:ABC-type sulfate transport system permease subunit